MGERLTTKEHWSRQWAGSRPSRLRLNPNVSAFREKHQMFRAHLPSGDLRFVELGCYPGSMMSYFHEHFGYRVSGIEYLGDHAIAAREMLAAESIDADVIHADVFEYEPPKELWDVVASFGFVEHFTDTADVMRHHLKLLRPGGWLVVSIPNHSGVNGSILKMVDKELYDTHNRMSCEALVAGIEATNEADIVDARYVGRFSLGNTGIYAYGLKRFSKLLFRGLQVGMRGVDVFGQLAPNGKWSSQGAVAIARKHG